MCAIVEEYAEKRAKEAAKEAERQSAMAYLKMGKLSAEEIAEGLSTMSAEDVIKLQKSML